MANGRRVGERRGGVCWMSVTMCSSMLADTRARLASGTSSARTGSAARSRSIGSDPVGVLIPLLLSTRHRGALHISRCPARVQTFQVVVRSSGESVRETRPGAMKADRDGIRRDPEHRCDLLVAQLFPGDEPQELLVGRRERRQGDEHRPVEVLAGSDRGRDVLDAQERGKSLAATAAAAMVGEHAPSDRVEPRERLGIGDQVELAPGDGEGLGGDVLGIGKRPGCVAWRRRGPAARGQ